MNRVKQIIRKRCTVLINARMTRRNCSSLCCLLCFMLCATYLEAESDGSGGDAEVLQVAHTSQAEGGAELRVHFIAVKMSRRAGLECYFIEFN